MPWTTRRRRCAPKKSSTSPPREPARRPSSKNSLSKGARHEPPSAVRPGREILMITSLRPPRTPSRRTARSAALTGLFVLASFYTLYFARDFFLPVTMAVLLSFLFNPVVRWLQGWHVP